jgi:hypothetical protein
MKHDLLPSTVVIPTRMRCPEPLSRMHYNPLCQCLDSLLAQRAKPEQVMVASAIARDHTEESLVWYRQAFARCGVTLDVLWIPDQADLGPFGKIALAFEALRHDVLHLVEDDVFLNPGAIGRGFELFQALREGRPRTGLVALPLYRRATRPTKILPYREMGQLDCRLRLTGCFESVAPREVALGGEYPNQDGVPAHAIDFFRGGNNVIRREALDALRSVRCGTPYGWEVAAGLHLKQHGWEMYYAPDASAAGMHSYYGAHWARRTFIGKDWTRGLPDYAGLSLREIVRNAPHGKPNTGLGPLPLDVYYFRVTSAYAMILAEYAPAYVEPWLRKVRSDFVEKVASDLTAGRQKVAGKRRREAIFLAALEGLARRVAWPLNSEVQASVEAAFELRGQERSERIERGMEVLCAAANDAVRKHSAGQ